MDAFKDFLTKAGELYLAAPAFFNWAAPILVAAFAGIVWFAWWLGGKLSEGEIAELKGKVEVLDQRLNFAKDRADAATKEVAEAKAGFEKLKKEIAGVAPREKLQDSADVFEGNLNRLFSANNSTASALGFVSTGFDERGGLKWRKIEKHERHLIDPIPMSRSARELAKAKSERS
ncbi:hypothetical protein HZZ13_06190 [Bradyrhizobium sp. CNPSo 4010]|uniref:Uncharacterized protein n=1 Tax=Bradyrhizobium agreste TaxID=2751811 RepID=A0ABS0PJJ5_9BRAD|nr:hypothetical protein [Bradyrhizobium agreste]MBH5397380.1 hypothetical protein [Bradyrhizobium agreste]